MKAPCARRQLSPDERGSGMNGKRPPLEEWLRDIKSSLGGYT